jgi:hypothetical protein
MTMGTNDPRKQDETSADPLDALLGNLQEGTGAPADEKADLAALLGGLAGSGQSTGGEADLGALLSGMLGGGGAQGGDVDLGALLGGLGGAGTASPSGGADLSALLGSLLGGGAGQESGSPDDFMSAALGGGQSGGGLLGSLLGGLLGGGSSMSGSVTESGGVSGALIQAAMGFLLQALANPQRSGVDTSDVMTRLGNDTLDTDYVRQSGLAAQFSQEANVDEDTAAETLTVALHALGGRTG